MGVVDIFSPKQEERNTPAAAAAERVMKLRRVSRLGNIERARRTPGPVARTRDRPDFTSVAGS
jgi:hypothetical protein